MAIKHVLLAVALVMIISCADEGHIPSQPATIIQLGAWEGYHTQQIAIEWSGTPVKVFDVNGEAVEYIIEKGFVIIDVPNFRDKKSSYYYDDYQDYG